MSLCNAVSYHKSLLCHPSISPSAEAACSVEHVIATIESGAAQDCRGTAKQACAYFRSSVLSCSTVEDHCFLRTGREQRRNTSATRVTMLVPTFLGT